MKEIGGKQVKIKDLFWSKWQEVVYRNVLPYQWEALNDRIADGEPSYSIANFKIAAEITAGTRKQADAKEAFRGCVFQDSDLAKWIEAASFSLNWHPDPALEAKLDEAIDLVCASQQPDGYLDTYYIINGLENRFTNVTDNHELYCLGHFLEAGCAYYHATGKRKLLDAMIHYVDLVDSVFGKEEGKKHGYPGHEVIEMALVKLYEITEDPRHLNLAAYFINERGQQPLYFAEEKEKYGNEFFWKDSLFQYAYYQADRPVREQEVAVGHAVRAVYLYSGMADVARETGDESLKQACHRMWEDVTKRQMYITGAIGSSAYGESFTFDYDLPNEQIYGESCASIGLVFFAMRMLKLDIRGEYADVMEKALYNTIISGISLNGTRFFYVNPMAVKPEALEKDQRLSHVKGERQKWFGCACCPPNIARMLSSLGDYIYTKQGGRIYQNLFVGSEMQTEAAGVPITLKTKTQYPWDGVIEVSVCVPEGKQVPYAFRLPGWCPGVRVMKNGSSAAFDIKAGYIYLDSPLEDRDILLIEFDMPAHLVKANPKVRQDVGKSALMRGPIVYCLEEEDNGSELERIHLGTKRDFSLIQEPDTLGGIVRITLTGEEEYLEESDQLYYDAAQVKYRERPLSFIPYYTWANRTPGEMLVWVND